MNSTFRRTPNGRAANAGLAAFIAALLLSAAPGAYAQNTLNIPGAASAPPPVVSRPAPAPVPVAPSVPAAAEDDVPLSQQPGGLEPPPAAATAPVRPPVARPAAMPQPRQNPNAAHQVVAPDRRIDQQMDRAKAEAVQRLNQITPEGLASADPALIGSELDRYTVQQRKLRELQILNKQAEETQKLYKTLFGDEAKVGQPKNSTPSVSEDEIKRRVEEARLDGLRQAEEERKQREQAEFDTGPRPVVAQIVGTARKRQAVVMLPCDRGSVTVSVGNRLTQGEDAMRVVSISEAGVEVSQKGKRFFLGFGNVSSRCAAPLAAVGAGSGGGHAGVRPLPNARPAVVMGGPLQISGGARMR